MIQFYTSLYYSLHRTNVPSYIGYMEYDTMYFFTHFNNFWLFQVKVEWTS